VRQGRKELDIDRNLHACMGHLPTDARGQTASACVRRLRLDSRSHLLWRREARRSPRVHRRPPFGWHQGGYDLVEGLGGFLQKSKLQLPGGVVVSGRLFEKNDAN
jgi:hypothetical protein